MINSETKQWHCDFCKVSNREVARMIVARDGAAICNNCVAICMNTLIEEIQGEANLNRFSADSKQVKS